MVTLSIGTSSDNNNTQIRRHLTCDNASSVQLHEFSDSTKKGYAAAVYLKVETPTSVRCHLVSGKSKVTPLKRCSNLSAQIVRSCLSCEITPLFPQNLSRSSQN